MATADQFSIRESVRRRRIARDASTRAAESRVMAQRFSELPELGSARCVAAFAALETEPDIWAPIARLHDEGCMVLLPRVAGPRRLEWGSYSGQESLAANEWGILEPQPPTERRLSEAAVIVVPAVAVDPTTGVRIGYGGGYYDAALAQMPPHRAGGALRVTLCFDDEVISGLPANEWDARVDVIVTPSRLVRV